MEQKPNITDEQKKELTDKTKQKLRERKETTTMYAGKSWKRRNLKNK